MGYPFFLPKGWEWGFFPPFKDLDLGIDRGSRKPTTHLTLIHIPSLPGPVPGGVQRPPPGGTAHFFAPLLTRRGKNWGVSNAQEVEGPHYFAPWRAYDKGGRVVASTRPVKHKGGLTFSSHISIESRMLGHLSLSILPAPR